LLVLLGAHHILHISRIRVKEMRNRKATGDNDVPGDGLKLLGEGGLKILTKLIKTIYEFYVHGNMHLYI